MQKVDAKVIAGINEGKETSFKILYDNYFVYLCAYATTYIQDADIAREIVNDVFIHVWRSKKEITFPVHRYLLTGVRFGCLSYLRNLRFRKETIEKYEMEFLLFEEELCRTDACPLHVLEMDELESHVRDFVDKLPTQCREIFRRYLYENMPPNDIATEMNLKVNTIRVQLKIAFDRLKAQFGSNALLAVIILFKSLHNH